ncbi:hypothetical protein POVWA2_023960 [Plasmodium ovale wallikeri]|uniref:PIR Superfamily Protein n=2 Tax=Plasmodium ovale TaxID=36330 RepID=A0A1A8YT19_PLAOA|nr:hypothetical protein POVWA1_024070 [Plasmodium ovale wallikeri]SBT35218.1 hypothetical protein POVWA2_023960 [Plasmodium ovale wallikeri]SBT72824.1 hypothetical protein, conserved [Plasmodium ovale]
MKIYSEQIKQFPKKHGNFIAQPLNNKSNILCVNDDSINMQSIHRFTKCNYKWFQDNFRFNLFTLPLNKCYNNAILKISTLIGICEFSIFAYAGGENVSASHSSESANEAVNGVSRAVDTVTGYLHKTQSYLETAINFIMAQIDCIKRVKVGNECKYARLVFPALVALFTLFGISVLYFFYKRGMCFCKPRSASKREEDELRAQIELMQKQMQMQQQQMRREMMDGSTTDSDEDEEDDEDEDEDDEDDEEEDEDDEEEEEEEEEEEKKKNNKRKNNEQEEKKKHENDEKLKHEDNKKQKEPVNTHNKGKNNSKNDNIHIGYHSSAK